MIDFTEEQAKYFCYLIVKQTIEAWIGIGFAVLALVLTTVACLQYCKAQSMNMINLSVKFIYITIFLWSALFLGKIAFGEIVFWHQNSSEESADAYFYLSIVSKYMLVVDTTGVFLIQTTLVLVCFNWVNDLVKQMAFLQGGAQDANLSFLKYQIMCRKMLKIYLVARFFFYLLFIPFIIVKDPYQEITIAKIMLILLIIQAFFVFVILIFGLALIRHNRKIKELVSQQDIGVMVNRYGILIICSIIRVVLDTIFVSVNFQRLADSKCYINNIKPGYQARNVLDFVMGGLFTHCLPIYIVLRIYNVRREEIDLSSSLLAAQESYNSSNCQVNETQQKKP